MVPSSFHTKRWPLLTESVTLPVNRIAYELAIAGLVAIIVSWWGLFISRPLATGIGQDFTTMYVGALSWLQGSNPYSTTMPVVLAAHLHVMQQGVVNSPLLLLFDAPLTLLPPKVAYLVFAGTQYVLAVLGSCLLAVSFAPRKRLLVTLAIVASPAMFLVGYYGQIGAFVFFFAAAGLWARRTGRAGLLGLCVACAFIKPQLGLCAALPLLWGAPRRAWASALVGASLLIALMARMLSPRGLVAYIQVLSAFDRSRFVHDNVDGLGITSLYRGWASPVWSTLITGALTGLLLIGLILVVKRYRTHPPDHALAMATYIGVLLLPYSHQYDSIALFPSLFVARTYRPARPESRWLFVCGVALIAVTPLMALSSHPFSFRLLPLGLGACLVGLARDTSFVAGAQAHDGQADT
jgi:hypothetical protein